MIQKLWALSVVGSRFNRKSVTVKCIVGYVFQPSKDLAEQYALAQWKKTNPRLAARLVNVIEVPTCVLPATRDHAALVPDKSIPGRQVRGLIGFPKASEAA